MKKTRNPLSKRLFDLIATAVGMIVALPVMAVTALLVRLKLGSPVLFCQKRPGLGGEIFTLCKFRSMLNAVGADGNPLPDEKRLTAFGAWLRSTSLDELPELFAVLSGKMSLVGPRPLLVQYLERYSPEQMRRHEMKPGITGWAQINGRNALSWEEKFALDVWYVDNWSFWLDIRILWLTVRRVLRREGISGGGEATMREFMGNDWADKNKNSKADI